MYGIKDHKELKIHLLKGGIWAFIGKVLKLLSSLLLNALLARLLSPDEVGAYFLTFSIITFFGVIAQFGMKITIVRLISESMSTGRTGRAKKSIYLAFIITALGSFMLASLYYIKFGNIISVSMFNSKIMLGIIGLTSIWIVLFAFQSLFSEVFRGFKSIGLASLFDGLISSIISVIIFYIIYVSGRVAGLSDILIITLVAWLTSCVIASIILLRKVNLFKSGDGITAKEVLTITWPHFISTTSLYLLSQSSLLIVGFFLPDKDAALYGSVLRLVTLVGVPLLILNAVIPPYIAEFFFKGELKKLEQMLRSSATITGIPSIIVLVILMIFSSSILSLLYGNFYREGAFILGVLSIGHLFNVWAGSCGNVLMMTGHQKIMMYISLISSSIAVISGILLVGHLGIDGVAYASTIALILQNICMLIYVKKKVGVFTSMTFKLSESIHYFI